MAGLILKLRANEKLLINGVVVKNGESKTRLYVETEGARILRLRDAMRAQEATTPVKRAYYLAQLGLTGDMAEEEARASLAKAITDLRHAFATIATGDVFDRAEKFLGEGNYYRTMRALGELIPVEAQLMTRDGPAISSPDAASAAPSAISRAASA